MASVVLHDVAKRYGDNPPVITGISLEIQEHEFMVLVGPSGCGKSTLLRMIAGLEEITAGTVSIGERDVTDLAPRARDVAMVFQTYALYPHMTVRQNMGYGLKARRTPKAEITRTGDEPRRRDARGRRGSLWPLPDPACRFEPAARSGRACRARDPAGELRGRGVRS